MIREYVCLDVVSLPRSDPVTQTCTLLFNLLKTDKTFATEYESLKDCRVRFCDSPLDLSHKIFCHTVHSFEGRGTDFKATREKTKKYHFAEMSKIDEMACVHRDPLLHELLNIFDESISEPITEPLKLAISGDTPLQTTGKLLWVLDNHPDLFYERHSMMSAKELMQWVNDIFDQKIAELVKSLKEMASREKALGIQPAAMIEGNRIPQEISKFIITNSGAINTGLLKYMKRLFTGSEEVVFNHDISIKQTLELFLSSPSLRETFATITTPENPESRIGTLIRVSLGLDRKAPLSATETKRVAMAALLSHLRQYASGSCFAAFLAINMKQTYLEGCLLDLMSLLNNGHLSREVDGTKKHFPFLMKMSNPSLNNSFTINESGQVTNGESLKGSITESTGLTAACRVMGITDPSRALLEIAAQNYGEVSPKILIEKLARYHASRTGTEHLAGKYYHEGCFAFGSVESNPLLKVWVNTIAGMAEGQANCYLGSCLMKSILHVFHEFLKKKNLPQIEIIEETILKDLALSIRYMYDPSIGFFGSEYEGGFVLYEANREGNRLKRIDNTKMFREFVLRILDKIRERLKKETIAISELEEFVSTSSFTNQVMESYKNLISASYHDLDEAEKVKPWINLFGHNANAILQVYFENKESLNTYKIPSKNGYDLMKQLLKMGRQLPPEEKEALLSNPYTLKPVRIINYHAFSLILGHPSLVEAWDEGIGIKEWIAKKILKPGRKIAFTPMSEGHRERLEHELQKRYSDLKVPLGISPFAFRKSILKLFPENKKEVAHTLDQIIVETLDPETKEILEGTLVHFADTNLQSGIQDVHFCFLVNPGSGKLEVWQVNDDNSGLTPMDQKLIAKNARWEIFLKSEVGGRK